jgi:hypothetical protein
MDPLAARHQAHRRGQHGTRDQPLRAEPARQRRYQRADHREGGHRQRGQQSGEHAGEMPVPRYLTEYGADARDAAAQVQRHRDDRGNQQEGPLGGRSST